MVPKKVFVNIHKKIPNTVSYENFLDLPMWDIQNYENQLFQLLDVSFVKNESQNKKNIIWGKCDETDLSIFYDENRMVDFTVRLDLRSLKKETLELIEQIGAMLDAVLVTELVSVIEPNSKNILDEIKLSKAFKFISNPSGFFDSNNPSKKLKMSII